VVNRELPIFVGTAAWTIPVTSRERFPDAGTHLERYAARLSTVEINSTFRQWHQPKTFARWAGSVPPEFRFALKLPQEITHERGLDGAEELLARFLADTSLLGDKRGPLLIQLPPRLTFDVFVAGGFFDALRSRYAGPAVCEPRHRSWFTDEADGLLRRFEIARVAADPPPVPAASEPGGWPGLVYYRWHGSPRIYYSNYEREQLLRLVEHLIAAAQSCPTWCIFDNTALGAATDNALDSLVIMRENRSGSAD
jgi:uncharacterized protein YecE (DUF72 family)